MSIGHVAPMPNIIQRPSSAHGFNVGRVFKLICIHLSLLRRRIGNLIAAISSRFSAG